MGYILSQRSPAEGEAGSTGHPPPSGSSGVFVTRPVAHRVLRVTGLGPAAAAPRRAGLRAGEAAAAVAESAESVCSGSYRWQDQQFWMGQLTYLSLVASVDNA